MAEAGTGQNSKQVLVVCVLTCHGGLTACTEAMNRHRTRSAEAVLRFKPAGLLKSKPHDATTRAELMAASMDGWRLGVVTIPPALEYHRWW